LLLLGLTLATFNRSMGRMPERRRVPRRRRVSNAARGPYALAHAPRTPVLAQPSPTT
jgi:hypothetical protein